MTSLISTYSNKLLTFFLLYLLITSLSSHFLYGENNISNNNPSTTIELLLQQAKNEEKEFHYKIALKCYEKILTIDQHNKKALAGAKSLHNLIKNYNQESYHETKAHMLLDVNKAWEPTDDIKQSDLSNKLTTEEPNTINKNTIITKLNSLIIPHINLENVSISEAVDYLKQKSCEQDPLKKGVNIFLKLTALEKTLPLASDSNALSTEPSISLQLNEVPLYVALEYVAKQANLTLKIDPYAVVLIPPSGSNDLLMVKEYAVPPHFIPIREEEITDKNGKHNEQLKTACYQAKNYFQAQGIEFPPEASANYLPYSNKLIVRSTQDTLDLIDILVAAAQRVIPSQISIETKFVEVSQDQLDQLGFNWLLGPLQIGNSGVYASGAQITPSLDVNNNPLSVGSLASGNSAIANSPMDTIINNGIRNTTPLASEPAAFNISGIYSPAQLQLMIKALNQKKGIDLMAAPHVTTKSGLKATVKIIDEFVYPTQYTPPQIPQSTTNGAGILNQTPPTIAPAFPSSWATKNIGVILEAKPTIEPDGHTINLELHPQTIDFDGFINYGTAINTIGYRALSLTNASIIPFSSTLTTNTINQPVFTVREVTTSVMVADGQTIVLGGLIREETQKTTDKVPILGDIPLAGRLFQSKTEKKLKKNLIIFVTPKILHADNSSS